MGKHFAYSQKEKVSFSLLAVFLEKKNLKTSLSSAQIIEIFNREFLDFNTRLVGGAEEPLYVPDSGKGAEIHFREDFTSSALHEIAHWCIAGLARLKLPDFGYWYAPDGRSADEQNKFYLQEVKPQALEWIFSDAAHVKFNISADNLYGDDLGALNDFKAAVTQQKERYLQEGMPPRAKRFVAALLSCYFTEAATLKPV